MNDDQKKQAIQSDVASNIPDFGDGAARFFAAVANLTNELSPTATALSVPTFRAPPENATKQAENAESESAARVSGNASSTPVNSDTEVSGERTSGNPAWENADTSVTNSSPSSSDAPSLDRIAEALTARLCGDLQAGWEGVHL